MSDEYSKPGEAWNAAYAADSARDDDLLPTQADLAEADGRLEAWREVRLIPEDIMRAAEAVFQTEVRFGQLGGTFIKERIARALMAERERCKQTGTPKGLSPWCGWDQSRMPWSDSKHKDAVLEALFRSPWSVEDAATLIGFIERTWPRSAAILAARSKP